MKVKLKIVLHFIFFAFLSILKIHGQQANIDSLKQVLKNAKHDSTRCVILSLITENTQGVESEKYNRDLLDLSESQVKLNRKSSPLYLFYRKYQGVALSNFGIFEYAKGNLDNAMLYNEKSLAIHEELKNKSGICGVLNDMALIYQARGDINKALEFNIKSLKLREELGDKLGIANSLNNLGLIYDSQAEYSKAIEYFNKCMRICEEIGDKSGITYALNNIGYSYQNQNEYVKALSYFLKSLNILEGTNDKFATAYALSNIGVFYSKFGDPDVGINTARSKHAGSIKALEYYQKSLKLREEIGDKSGVAQSLSWMANIYTNLKMYDKALEHSKRALALSQETGIIKNIMSSSGNLSNVYKLKGNYKLALQYYVLHSQMRDSMRNESTRKASIKTQLKYEYEKQAAADSVAHAKENEVNNALLDKQTAEIKAKKNQQYALFGGLALVIVFAGFMYNRFKITQKQKRIIEEQKAIVEVQKMVVEEQKKIVEEQQKEVLDSIHYAKRIQTALLPNEKFIAKSIKRLMK